MMRIARTNHSEATEQEIREINFAIKQMAQKQHKCAQQFFISKTLWAKIVMIRSSLSPDSGISWTTPIAHMIPRTHSFSACVDACFFGGGLISVDLKFWLHLEWPQQIQHHTKLFLHDNSTGRLISINVLEYATIIINYAASLTVLEQDGLGEESFPVLLNWAANTSAVR